MKYIFIWLKQSILRLIRFYQKTFSPDHGYFSLIHPWPGACKFQPTCSEYAYQAIEKYGLLKGVIKSLRRILRCHPWAKGGWDKP